MMTVALTMTRAASPILTNRLQTDLLTNQMTDLLTLGTCLRARILTSIGSMSKKGTIPWRKRLDLLLVVGLMNVLLIHI